MDSDSNLVAALDRLCKENGSAVRSNMMEEIDRFQVPNAVQEAEMRAEMQPLVSLRRDEALLALFSFSRHRSSQPSLIHLTHASIRFSELIIP